MRRRSLTTRLTLSHVLVTLAGILVLGLALIVLVRQREVAQTAARLSAQATLYASYASAVASDADALAGIAPDLVRRFTPGPDATVRVIAPNGTLLYASHPDLGRLPSSAVLPLLPNPLPIQPLTIETGRRFAAAAVVRGEQTIGVIEVSQTTAPERVLVRRLLGALLPSAAIALVGAALVGHLLARGLIRPLSRLGRVAAAIGRGEIDARSDDRGRDEIGQVAAQLNSMADELQARIAEVERLADARQQFYRSVSHELRTPLTAIRGSAENLDDDATPEQRESLQIIQSEAARLQRLVDELLSPRDSAPAPLRRRRAVDIGALLDETGRIMVPRAERSAVTLRWTADPGLVVGGDHDRLKQALLNLVDNALTWTPPGGTIELRARQADRSAQVTISDSGPGVDAALGESIWERGVSASGGAGLGLPLVRDIVAAHGGTVALRGGPGTTIELDLPLIDRAPGSHTPSSGRGERRQA